MDILQAETGEVSLQLKYPDDIDTYVTCLDVSPDGNWIALGQAKQPVTGRLRTKKFYSGELPIQVRDAATGNLVKELRGHREGTYGIRFDANSERIVSAGADGSVKIWDLKKGIQRMTLKKHEGAVLSVDFDPSGNRIASAGLDGNVLVWDLGTGRSKTVGTEDGVLRGLALGAKETIGDSRVFSVRYAADGKAVVTGSFSGINAYDGDGSGPLPLFDLQIGVVKRTGLSPDGDTLVTVGNQIHVWDTETGSRRHTLEGQGSKSSAIRL